MCTVSVVIIGRNSERDLLRLNAVSNQDLLAIAEIIYVDSCSTDNSVDIALGKGWRVLRLCCTSVISAAAGRNAGASVATGDYILFLDSDMVFQSDVSLPKLLDHYTALFQENVAGAVGETVDICESGARRIRFARHKHGADAHSIGGLVFLRRDVLLNCGNWDGAVIANEENELYARLRHKGFRILYDCRFRCLHYCGERNRLIELVSQYVPYTKKALRVYGACGMAMAAASKAGAFRSWFWIDPAPVLSFAGVVVGALLGYFSNFLLGVFTWVVICAVIATRRSLSYLAICPSLPMQLVVGFLRYKRRVIGFRECKPSSSPKAGQCSRVASNLESCTP